MKIENISEHSPHWRAPPCPHFGACGGCRAQHVSPEFYRDWKRQMIIDALKRTGLPESAVGPLITIPARSRRRATLTAHKDEGRVALGFNARQSSLIVPIPHCQILVPALMAVLDPLQNVLLSILNNKQSIDISLTALPDGVDILLIGAIDLTLPRRQALASFLVAQSLVARISWVTSVKAVPEVLLQSRPVRAIFGSASIPFPPGVFLQASAEGESALVQTVLQYIGKSKKAADLFAGCGTFTFPLAQKAHVHAVEGDAAACSALKEGAKGNHRISIERRNLDKDPLTVKELNAYDTVVFDPPRTGALAQSSQLARSTVPHVIAVSCNPATFARDARTLVDGGYRLELVTPVDQFVWSAHLEVVSFFAR